MYGIIDGKKQSVLFVCVVKLSYGVCQDSMCVHALFYVLLLDDISKEVLKIQCCKRQEVLKSEKTTKQQSHLIKITAYFNA